MKRGGNNNSGPAWLLGAAIILFAFGTLSRLGWLPSNLNLTSPVYSQSRANVVEVFPTAAPAPAYVQAQQALQASLSSATIPTAVSVVQQAITAPTMPAVVPTAGNQQVVTQPTMPPAQVQSVAPTTVAVQAQAATEPQVNAQVGGHCTDTASGCSVFPTATPAPTYDASAAYPTALPPTPTVTPSLGPESNSISSIVVLQGQKNHAGTSIIVMNEQGVAGNAVTNEGGLFQITGLDKGRYQIAAYSLNGTHWPACGEFSVSGDQSIAIPQAMLGMPELSSGQEGEVIGIGAAALVAIALDLKIPDHLVPLLDVNGDGTVTEIDGNMIITDPTLLRCQLWQ